MKTAPKSPAGAPSGQPEPGQGFSWLAFMQCCDGWGLFHAPVDVESGPAARPDDPGEDGPDKLH